MVGGWVFSLPGPKPNYKHGHSLLLLAPGPPYSLETCMEGSDTFQPLSGLMTSSWTMNARVVPQGGYATVLSSPDFREPCYSQQFLLEILTFSAPHP